MKRLIFLFIFISNLSFATVFETIKEAQSYINHQKPELALEVILNLEDDLKAFGEYENFKDVTTSIKAVSYLEMGQISKGLETAKLALSYMNGYPSHDPIVKQFRPQLNKLIQRVNALHGSTQIKSKLKRLARYFKEGDGHEAFSVKREGYYELELKVHEDKAVGCSIPISYKKKIDNQVVRNSTFMIDFDRIQFIEKFRLSSSVSENINEYFVRLHYSATTSNSKNTYSYLNNAAGSGFIYVNTTIDISLEVHTDNDSRKDQKYQRFLDQYKLIKDIWNTCKNQKLNREVNQEIHFARAFSRNNKEEASSLMAVGTVTAHFNYYDNFGEILKTVQKKCGGALYSKTEFITAASCLYDKKTKRPASRVTFKHFNFIENDNRNGIEHRGKSFYISTAYKTANKSNAHQYDIGVVIVDDISAKNAWIYAGSSTASQSKLAEKDYQYQTYVVGYSDHFRQFGGKPFHYVEQGCNFNGNDHNCLSTYHKPGTPLMVGLKKDLNNPKASAWRYIFGIFSKRENSMNADYFIPLTNRRLGAMNAIRDGRVQSVFEEIK